MTTAFDLDRPTAVPLDRWPLRSAELVGPDAVAVHGPDGPLTYGAVAERISATAGWLVAAGVGPGDRVAWCGPNRVEVFELLLACARLGAVLVPLNNRLTPAELAVLVDRAEPRVLVGADEHLALLGRAAGARPVHDLAVARPADTAGAAVTPHPSGAGPGPETPVLMVFTSGTTGRARGAVLTQGAIAHTVANSLDHQGIGPDDVILSVLPTFHVGGLNIQSLPALAVGAALVLPPGFDPGGTLALIERHRPTQTVFVPAVLDAVAAHPRFAQVDLGSLVGVNSGSSVVPLASMAPWFARGVPVGQVYGATETGPTAVVLRYDEAEAHQGSAGRPARHSEVRIAEAAEVADTTDSSDALDGAGEILIRGPHLFDHYWRDPDATADAFVDGWYRTGDVGRFDDDGYLWVQDRVRDVYISGGENVYPAEVEAVLAEHPALAEVTVVGRPDDRWGEVGVAVVVARDPGAVPTAAELRDWARGRLARFKQPQEVVAVEALPRTALGKVRKHVVRRDLGLG